MLVNIVYISQTSLMNTDQKKIMKTQTVLSLADSHHIGSKHNQK